MGKKIQKLNYLQRQEESLFEFSLFLSISVALCFLLSINLVVSASLSLSASLLSFPSAVLPLCGEKDPIKEEVLQGKGG
jgi:hypothetical protein